MTRPEHNRKSQHSRKPKKTSRAKSSKKSAKYQVSSNRSTDHSFRAVVIILLVLGVSIALGFGLWEASKYLLESKDEVPEISGRNIIVLVGTETVAGFSPIKGFDPFITDLQKAPTNAQKGLRAHAETSDVDKTPASEWGCEPRVGAENIGKEYERDISILRSLDTSWEVWPPSPVNRVKVNTNVLRAPIGTDGYNISNLSLTLQLGFGECRDQACFGPEYFLGTTLEPYMKDKSGDATSQQSELVIVKVSASGGWWQNRAELENYLFRAAKDAANAQMDASPDSHLSAFIWVGSRGTLEYPHVFMRQFSEESWDLQPQASEPALFVAATSSIFTAETPLPGNLRGRHHIVAVPDPCLDVLQASPLPMAKLGTELARALLDQSDQVFPPRPPGPPAEEVGDDNPDAPQPTAQPTLPLPQGGNVYGANVVVVAGQSNVEGYARTLGLESISRTVQFIQSELSSGQVSSEQMEELVERLVSEILRPHAGRSVGCDGDASLGDMARATAYANATARVLIQSSVDTSLSNLIEGSPRFTASRVQFPSACSEPCSPYTDPHLVVPITTGLGFGESSALFGPELFLGKRLEHEFAEGDTRVHVVKVAMGGSSLAREWTRGSSTRSWLLSEMQRFQAMPGNRIAGVVWFQGNSDANPTDIEAYRNNLQQLIAETREDLKLPSLPFIVVKPLHRTEALKELAEIQQQVSNDVEAVRTIPTEGLSTCYHYDTGSMAVIGERIAAAMLEDKFFNLH